MFHTNPGMLFKCLFQYCSTLFFTHHMNVGGTNNYENTRDFIADSRVNSHVYLLILAFTFFLWYLLNDNTVEKLKKMWFCNRDDLDNVSTVQDNSQQTVVGEEGQYLKKPLCTFGFDLTKGCHKDSFICFKNIW